MLRQSLGRVHMSLSVATAKTLAEEGRLFVYLSGARVHILEQKPLRYYRYMDVGYTRLVCGSLINRRGMCFRCGESGHIAQQYTSLKLHCTEFADSDRSPDLYMGWGSSRPRK